MPNPRSKKRRHILALAARRSTRQPSVTTEHSNAMETSDDIIAVDERFCCAAKYWLRELSLQPRWPLKEPPQKHFTLSHRYQ
ncbi:hypothetical protein V8E54_005479 [Elaphomyces granulatus]